MTKRIGHGLCVFVFVAAVSVCVSAQTSGSDKTQRGPSSPIRPFLVLPAQSLAEVERKLRPDNKTEELIGGEGMELRVAVQHEKDKAAPGGELHDASDDVYYVLEGSATLTLGGKLEAPHEVEPGEWRGPRINGGQTVEIVKGDLIVVPRGTPHMRSTVGKDFSMLLIKVYDKPLPKPASKPAPPAKPQKP